MAVKKPLVLTNGNIEQLQSGDSIGAVETGQTSAVAAASITAGFPVYPSSAGNVSPAKANALSTSKVTALATADISSSASGVVQTNGVLTLTTTQWDAIAGTTGGLTAGATYFLSAATAGNITATAPSTAGQCVVQIGIALSTTDLSICIGAPIKL